MSLKLVRHFLWILVGVEIVLLGISFYASRDNTKSESPKVNTASIGGPFRLTSHKGETFDNARLAGRPYLVFFGFTHCPDICPTTLYQLTELMKGLGPDAEKFTPLFITVDPARDTQEFLAEYMTAFDDRIVALRGDQAQTDSAVKAFAGYYKKVPLDGGNYTMDHTASVILMNGDGEFAGTLDIHEPRENMIAKLRRLMTS